MENLSTMFNTHFSSYFSIESVKIQNITTYLGADDSKINTDLFHMPCSAFVCVTYHIVTYQIAFIILFRITHLRKNNAGKSICTDLFFIYELAINFYTDFQVSFIATLNLYVLFNTYLL